MKKGEEQETYELILRVFHRHVAPVYSKNGVAKFLSMLSPAGLSERNGGKKSFVIMAKDQSFYEETGFEVLGDEINEEGMRFTPMQKLL